MSTRMEGITQQSLFAGKTQTMEVLVTENNRYRVLAKNLPWRELGEVANAWRAKRVNIDNGRPLNLRLHLGALIAQGMNRWTDRETEEAPEPEPRLILRRTTGRSRHTAWGPIYGQNPTGSLRGPIR